MAQNRFFHDTFTEGSDTAITSHTPDTGTGWTEIDTVGSLRMEVSSANGDLRPDGNSSSDGQTCTADATYSSANYQVKVDVLANPSGGDEYLMLYGRYSSKSNNGYYSANISASSSNDMSILKGTGASSETTLVSYDNTDGAKVGANTEVIFQLFGSELALFTDEVAYLYTTDSNVTAAGKAGVGMGAYWVNTTGDMSISEQQVDNFEVWELAANETSWNSPTTTGETDNTWGSPTNAYSSDKSRATMNLNDAQDFGDFGFSISADNTIRGISVQVESLTDSSGYHELDVEVSKDNGSTWSTAKRGSYIDFDSSDGIVLYGHARSLWGLSWNPSDLNDSNFRVRVTFAGRENSFVTDVEVDAVLVKVYYDTGAAPTTRRIFNIS